MYLYKITLLVFLSLFSCKKTNIQDEKTKSTTPKIISTVLNKENFINTKWRAIDYVNNGFKKMTIKEEWQSFVKINKKDAIIYLQEPTKYNLDSIQATRKSIILHIKGGGWIYKFKWIDKKRHIGRWDYIYNKTIIDSSFSMYVVDEKYIDDLSKN